jgi:hypothetical protein
MFRKISKKAVPQQIMEAQEGEVKLLLIHDLGTRGGELQDQY